MKIKIPINKHSQVFGAVSAHYKGFTGCIFTDHSTNFHQENKFCFPTAKFHEISNATTFCRIPTWLQQCAGSSFPTAPTDTDVTRDKNVTGVDCVWNVMTHAQKTRFVFRRNGGVHLNRRGHQFSRLLAAEVCASAVVMLDTPCCELVWRVLATHSIRQFPLHFPSRASPCAITFQLDSTTYWIHRHASLNDGSAFWEMRL